MNLILLGAPGTGKGTIAKNLEEKYGLPHISTGDLFRKNIKENTKLGQEAKSYMDKGELVPDDITVGMLADRLNQDGNLEAGFLLDGFPRTIAQAEALEKLLAEHGESLDIALNVYVPYGIIKKRISGRVNCPKCGASYNIYSNPPEKEGVCDVCGTELVQREDDKPETVENRLKTYEENTKPLIDYYEDKGILKTVDNSGDLSDTLEQVQEVLKTND